MCSLAATESIILAVNTAKTSRLELHGVMNWTEVN